MTPTPADLALLYAGSHLLLFAFCVLYDVLVVVWWRQVREGNAAWAAGWSFLLSLISFLAAYFICDLSPWYALSASLGHAAGTFVAVRWGRSAEAPT